VVSEILNLTGQGVSGWFLTNEGELELDTNHTILGNSMRFKRGNIELSWTRSGRGGMRISDARHVTALTWALLLRYDYLGTEG
jgi:hypothetical protein